MAADLSISAIQEAARAAIQEASLFAGDEIEGIPQVPVIAVDGLEKDERETALGQDGPGAAIEVSLPFNGRKRDQRGDAVILDSNLLVLLHINPKRNAEAGAAGLDVMAAIRAIIAALIKRPRHPGGEFFKLAEEAFTLEQAGGGLIVYAIEFSKEATL